jgi:hypothetical protein
MSDLLEKMRELRGRLDGAFRPDTASKGFPGNAPSSGHCAAVSVIVHEMLGGEMISTLVDGHSHWINRIDWDDLKQDVDLTGDQFGRASVQVGYPGDLYPGLRVRTLQEVNLETLQRARLLAQRAELNDVAHSLEDRIVRRNNSQSQHA